jgi:GTP-binding protein Era
VPVVVAVNKIDRVSRGRTPAALQEAADLEVGQEVFPVSARTGAGVQPLTRHLVSLLPDGPFYFEAQQHSDQSEHVRLAELVREQVLRRTREEVPHAVEVQVESIDRRQRGPEPLLRIEAVVLAETESQKRILIGAHGRMIKAIGIAARRVIEDELGVHVHLELRVQVRRHWRADDRLLDRLGIE